MVSLLADPDQRGRLLIDIGVTYERLAIGYVLGSVIGVIAGITMGLSATVRFCLGPLVSATFPTPKLAIFPLLIVIFGLGDPSKIALVALGVFYMTCINTLSGVLYMQSDVSRRRDGVHVSRPEALVRGSSCRRRCRRSSPG